MSLYNELRPKTFKEVVGQEQAVKTLTALLKNGFPHTVMFSGMTGTGKTTLARIVAKRLGCNSDLDLSEINCAAVDSPIEAVREMIRGAGMSPNDGSDCRVWILEEAQALSRAGFAQQSLLKVLEEPPGKSYFLITTTDPDKVIAPIRNRCTNIVVRPIPAVTLERLVRWAMAKKGWELDRTCVEKIVEQAEGSARKAIGLLEQVSCMSPDEQLDALEKTDTRRKAIDLCKALTSNRPWSEVAKIIKALDDDPEQLRRMVLSWATTTALGGGKMAQRAVAIIEAFQFDWFASGRAGLVASCYQVCTRK